MAGFVVRFKYRALYRPLAGPACALRIGESLRIIVQAIRFDKLGVIEKTESILFILKIYVPF